MVFLFLAYHGFEFSLPLLRIGHTRLAARKSPPVSGHCQVCISILHVLVECPACMYVPHNRLFPSLTLVPSPERLSSPLRVPVFSSLTLFAFLRVSDFLSDI